MREAQLIMPVLAVSKTARLYLEDDLVNWLLEKRTVKK
jgi:hypothetical protein